MGKRAGVGSGPTGHALHEGRTATRDAGLIQSNEVGSHDCDAWRRGHARDVVATLRPVEFGILGTLTAREGDAEIPVPGTRLRTLLALLLVADGGVVTADRLADDLWGDAIPAGAANALQSLVSKLRRTLGAHGALVVTEPLGYRLDVDASEVDARGFERELTEGRSALDADDAAAAADRIAAALGRWRGPALDGLAD